MLNLPEDMLLKNMSNNVSRKRFGIMHIEFKQFLNELNISRSSNELKFCSDSGHFIPVLSEIALKYFISFATSEPIAAPINRLVPNNHNQTAEQ